MEKESTIACPRCMAPNSGASDTCIECGTTLSEVNMLDPFASLHAQSVAVSGAVYRPARLIVVITIWAIFLPGLIGSLFGMLSSIAISGMTGFVFFWLFAGLAILSAVALFRVTKNYITSAKNS